MNTPLSPHGDRDAPVPVTIAALRVSHVGGEEIAIAELANGLRARGHKVTIVAAQCDLVEDELLKVVRLPVPVRPMALASLLLMSVGSIVVWRSRVGLLHIIGPLFLNRREITTAHFCAVAFRGRKRAPRRSRDTLPYRINEWLTEHLAWFGEYWSYNGSRTSRIVSVSPGGAAELAQCFPSVREAIEVIPSAVDLNGRFQFDPDARTRIRREIGLGQNDLVVLFVGGDWGRKQLKVGIEAVALSPPWHLVIVGDGDRLAYEQLAVHAGVKNRVHFCGQISDTAPYYSAADAFVLPSSYETFGLVVYEAAAVGLPLLATRVSGVEELLCDGENGFFISPDPTEISRRLDALAEGEELRLRMGTNARRAVSQYTWDHVVDRYEQVYADVIAALDGHSGRSDGIGRAAADGAVASRK